MASSSTSLALEEEPPELLRFREHLRDERRLSSNTVTAYCTDLLQLYNFVQKREEASPSLLKLDRDDLRHWLREQSMHCGSTTLARKVGSLRAFFRFYQKLGRIVQNPAARIRLPKLKGRLPLIVSVEAASELVESRATDDSPMAMRDTAALELLYGGGLRVGELVGLDLSSVDFSLKVLRVRGKGKKDRLVPLGDKGLYALKSYLACRDELRRPSTSKEDDGALFLGVRGGRLGARRVQELVQRMGALVSGRADLHPHALRHACATHMLEGGADLRAIQDLLGHESVVTTQRYTHLSTRSLAAIYDRAHPLALRSPKEEG